MIRLIPNLAGPIFSLEQEEAISTVLSKGGVIVYPTDTLYGFGVDVTSSSAVERVYQLKSRVNAPVSVLTSSVGELLEMVQELPEEGEALIQHFMPGALTVICHPAAEFAAPIPSASGTVGFRVPGDPVSTLIPKLLGRPITTTSVNPAGLTPANSYEDVIGYYKTGIDLMIDIGPIAPSQGSTVIDLTVRPFKILREGEIPRQALEDFLN